MDREEKQRLIRRLTQAFNRIDGAYYYCARRLGVEENTLALLYALDDGRPHSQKQVYAAENAALEAMLAKFSAEFISVYEAFADELCAQFRARMPQNGRQRGTRD